MDFFLISQFLMFACVLVMFYNLYKQNRTIREQARWINDPLKILNKIDQLDKSYEQFEKDYDKLQHRSNINLAMAMCRVFGEDRELSDLDPDGHAVCMSYKNAIFLDEPVILSQDGQEHTVYGISYDYAADLRHLNEIGRKLVVTGVIDKNDVLKNPYQELIDGHHNGLEAITSLKWKGGDEAMPLDRFDNQNLATVLMATCEATKKSPKYYKGPEKEPQGTPKD